MRKYKLYIDAAIAGSVAKYSRGYELRLDTVADQQQICLCVRAFLFYIVVKFGGGADAGSS